MAARDWTTPVVRALAGGQANPSERIVAALVARIVAADLRDGDEISFPEDLPGELEATPPTFKRALDLVCAMGLAEAQSQGTYTVDTCRAMALTSQLRSRTPAAASLMARLMITLFYIEPPLALAAAMSSTRRNVSGLRECLALMVPASEVDPGDFAGQDLAFHRLIAEISGNQPFSPLVGSIREYLTRQRPGQRIEFSRDRATAQQDHTLLYNSIRDRDPASAYRQMQTHIDHWIGANARFISGLYRGHAATDTDRRHPGLLESLVSPRGTAPLSKGIRGQRLALN